MKIRLLIKKFKCITVPPSGNSKMLICFFYISLTILTEKFEFNYRKYFSNPILQFPISASTNKQFGSISLHSLFLWYLWHYRAWWQMLDQLERFDTLLWKKLIRVSKIVISHGLIVFLKVKVSIAWFFYPSNFLLASSWLLYSFHLCLIA